MIIKSCGNCGRNLKEEEINSISTDYLEKKPIKQIYSKYGIRYDCLKMLISTGRIPQRIRTRSRAVSLNETVFEHFTSESEAAYWIGFLLADGYVSSKSSEGQRMVALVLSAKDKDHLEKFRNFLNSGHSIGEHVRTRKDGRISYECGLCVRSEKLASSLEKLGVCNRKTLQGSVPTYLTMSKSFWLGMIDGDGHLGSYGVNSFRVYLLGNEAMLLQFREFCNSLGFRCNILEHLKQTEGLCRQHVSSPENLEFMKILYDTSPVRLERKYMIWSENYE